MFVVQNRTFFLTNTENYNLDTRQRNNLYLPQANLAVYQKGAYYSGITIFNHHHHFYFSVYPFLGVVPEDVEMVKLQSYNDYSFHKNT